MERRSSYLPQHHKPCRDRWAKPIEGRSFSRPRNHGDERTMSKAPRKLYEGLGCHEQNVREVIFAFKAAAFSSSMNAEAEDTLVINLSQSISAASYWFAIISQAADRTQRKIMNRHQMPARMVTVTNINRLRKHLESLRFLEGDLKMIDPPPDLQDIHKSFRRSLAQTRSRLCTVESLMRQMFRPSDQRLQIANSN